MRTFCHTFAMRNEKESFVECGIRKSDREVETIKREKAKERYSRIGSYRTHNPKPCRVGSVSSVSASRTVGREFASRPGHTKDHHKNGTNCLHA